MCCMDSLSLPCVVQWQDITGGRWTEGKIPSRRTSWDCHCDKAQGPHKHAACDAIKATIFPEGRKTVASSRIWLTQVGRPYCLFRFGSTPINLASSHVNARGPLPQGDLDAAWNYYDDRQAKIAAVDV